MGFRINKCFPCIKVIGGLQCNKTVFKSLPLDYIILTEKPSTERYGLKTAREPLSQSNFKVNFLTGT